MGGPAAADLGSWKSDQAAPQKAAVMDIKEEETAKSLSVSSGQLFYTVLLSDQRGGTPSLGPEGREELEVQTRRHRRR